MKKKIVEVDEDVLKEIIVGDILFSARTASPRKKSPWNIRKRKAPPQRTGRYSSGKALRGEAQKEKG